MARFRTILLATDGTPSSESAVTAAIDLAADTGATLVALCVTGEATAPGGGPAMTVDPIGSLDSGIVAIEEPTPSEARSAASTCAGAAAQQAIDRGVAARAIVWEGPAGPSIVAAAEAEQADIIVVGSHGRSVLGQLVSGSVSEHLVHHAHVPVLVVRPAPAS